MNPILVALDLPDLSRAQALARSLAPVVGGFKVGLELLMAEGGRAVSQIADLGQPVFADAKLHDIPNTVYRAAKQLAMRDARWVTVHASGGPEMLEAANEGLHAGAPASDVGILGVTVLTSLDRESLELKSTDGSVLDITLSLATRSAEAGLEGVICSPQEVSDIKTHHPMLRTVTPGIRPVGIETHDQKRTATPLEALQMGADFLVIGRPITAAPDPILATRMILDSIGA